ncbi:MAG: class I SAM-dependent methyltransferase [Sterolibacterium sp.]|nr:class I SAM-dependent methyltransferase [Sterolibacterium sp.]
MMRDRSAQDPPATISWSEADQHHSARWHSESGLLPPRRVVIVNDCIAADAAYRLACEGTGLLWRGDFQNARQLLQALARRADRKPDKRLKSASSPLELFHWHRQAQSQRARTLAMLLLPFSENHSLPLRRAPDVRQACEEAYGPGDVPYVVALRELLGLIGAHEWRKKGIEIPALGGRIHPHYGVFAPIRGEYLDLVAAAPLPSSAHGLPLAFDIGTGTGVLAALLARRGVARIVATDQDCRALACARENIERLGLNARVEVIQADIFPAGRAPLVVCNPPWVPARPSSPLERAIFDPESGMLSGFLKGLAAHLEAGGEGWLILSDLAEHMGLRTRAELLAAFDAANLRVVGRMDARPYHPRVAVVDDPLHAARAAELTSLWRLALR